ncbi:alpha/beta fold hydrolase [Nocardia wallacei]|uniref:Alpha/beta hydrolase n=1 Tax=Nocardia wallacei TaxID=480035 RepID=A0A7G1KLJ0_9NOCA|nr:alpha/beta hydrolase [Nocardia wallacei]BCK56105.1 alpha/beta hydrolase [Nocardia wallacei]
MRYFVARGENRRLDPDTRRPLRGSFVECSDGVTHYELTGPGDGPLVVLAPGLTVPLFYWDGLAGELHRQGFRTLAYSAYGRGYSDRVRAVYDDALFVRQLSDLISRLGLTGPWHVIGTSMGAVVAAAFVEQHVEQTATLTLAGPAGLEPPMAATKLLRHHRLSALVGRYLGGRLLRTHLSHNVRDPQLSARLSATVNACYEFEGSIYALFATLADFPLTGRQDLYARVGRLPVPSLLLWGADDRVTPMARMDQMRRLLTPTRWHVLERCGHMAPYERPGEVAAEFDAFARRAGQAVR